MASNAWHWPKIAKIPSFSLRIRDLPSIMEMSVRDDCLVTPSLGYL